MTELDPQPWILASPGIFGVRSARDGGRNGDMGWEWLFSPRRQFEQSKDCYVLESEGLSEAAINRTTDG